MHPPQPCVAATAPTPLRRAMAALLDAGRDLLARVQAALTQPATPQPATPLPRHLARAPATAEQRIARTLEWLAALAATLAGDRTWLRPVTYSFPRFPGRYPSLTAARRAEIGLPPVPPPTSAQKAASRRRYMQTVFATQPTAKIAKRLARRLGLTDTAEAWPRALLEITQTPAAWAKSAHAKPAPTPTPTPAPPSPLPPDDTKAAKPPPIATGPP